MYAQFTYQAEAVSPSFSYYGVAEHMTLPEMEEGNEGTFFLFVG